MAKKLRAFVVILLAAGLTYWFLKSSEWALVGKYLSGVKLWPLALGFIVINLTMLARSLRWQVLLAPIAPIKLDNAMAATAIGFGSLFVVGRASEIIRPLVLSMRENLKPSATLATILIERIYDTAAVVSLFAFNLLFFTLPTPDSERVRQLAAIRGIGLFLLIGLVLGIATLALLRLKAPQIIGWLEAHLTYRWFQPVLNLVKHLADGLSVLVSLRALALSLFYTGCVWTLVTSGTWLVLYAFGQHFALSQVIFVLGFGLIGSLVPTPGGAAGAFHATAAKGFEFLGLEHNLAAAIAIVYHLIAFGSPLLVGLFYLMRDGVRISQLRAMLAQEMTAQASTATPQAVIQDNKL
ncbi:MAG: flippase-like domain-containing protein [Acidobacteria bacterium]|nr:flippase-like domain-containing protein [Acidobacteriota bacterium]MBI3423381.1 flippase-like domain-containing protein [Acidobacteriota bacterium]